MHWRIQYPCYTVLLHAAGFAVQYFCKKCKNIGYFTQYFLHFTTGNANLADVTAKNMQRGACGAFAHTSSTPLLAQMQFDKSKTITKTKT